MTRKTDFEKLCIGDIVRTPKGALAIVVCRGRMRSELKIAFPEENRGERNAWWAADDGLQLECKWSGAKSLLKLRAGKRRPQ